MAFQSARLTTIFGASPETVSYEQLQALTSNEAAGEAEDLDYKLRYDAGDKGSDDIAVDIATFANHLGGVIIVGMAEANARPSKAVGIELTDAFQRRIRTCVAGRVFPQPQFDMRAVPDPTDTSATPRGLLLIMVPRSPLAPHAVLDPKEKEKLRWPRRHGTGKIWMSESDIATGYRRRFVAAAEQSERLTTVEAQCLEAIQNHKDKGKVHDYTAGLLLVSLAPDLPGHMIIDRDSHAQFNRDIQQDSILIGSNKLGELTRVGVGRRRLTAETAGWPAIRAELHSDGSGAVAIHLPGQRPEAGPSGVWDSSVTAWTASALRLLGRHARDRVGVSGSAATSASLHPYAPILNGPPVLGGSLIILTVGFFGDGRDVLGGEPQMSARGEADFLIDHLANDGQELAQATERLVSDLFQSFNAVGTRQITREGELALPAWGSERETAEQWARAANIPIAKA
ncbi:hypothetical protein Acsp03_71710 [Actinomadura sp. NBRC 104412]|uniref:AlbA family DNA-binding domain-containing protein n=1 Tax=Actinomadura sp. NBRC 104412 TaxID=3032203 RepID=UPI00249FF322|nr:ATP-binding protein [Actinomadura sp. NBRC 104412]GLZ09705.1 hypothetical protein Acsp03_71710 [Actinomadura sp. NBRC 104412]